MTIKDFFFSLMPSRRRDRLDSAITVYRLELEARKSTGMLSKDSDAMINKALVLLDLAQNMAREGNIDKGWKCFHGAQRTELFSLKPEVELQARLKVLREEATKLHGWRKDAIYELLGTSKHPVAVTDHYTAYTAELIRDEHYNNQAYKASLCSDFNKLLVCLLLVVLLIIFWMITAKKIQFSGDVDTTFSGMFSGIAIFGLFGAVVSAIIKQIDLTSKSSTIPENVTAWQVTGLRIFGGMAFSLIIFIFLKSRIISGVFSSDIAGILKDPTPYTIYSISFCSGFTERIVLLAVKAVEGK